VVFDLGVGFVALVHENGQAPLIETSGIYLEPGRQHKLNFRKKATYLLSAPYSSCTDNVPLPMKVTFDNYYHDAEYGYSERVCYGLCAQSYV
jgi:Amiloride-sensitive sodium channel